MNVKNQRVLLYLNLIFLSLIVDFKFDTIIVMYNNFHYNEIVVD